MFFPSIETLRSSDESTVFLLSSWVELFSTDAPVFYQPRQMHFPALVEELAMISSRAERLKKWEKHVRKIQEEIKDTVQGERGFLDKIPGYGWALDRLCETASIPEITALAKLLQPHGAKYESEAIAAFREAVPKLPAAKYAALNALQRLATIALRGGRGMGDFESLAAAENFSKPPNEIAELIIDTINSPVSEFTCIVAVNGNPVDLQVIGRKAGFEFVSERHLPNDRDGIIFQGFTSGRTRLSLKVSAKKASEAAQKAIRQLRPALDIFNFYKHASFFFWDTVLVVGGDFNSVLVTPQWKWSWQTRPRRNAIRLTKTLLDSAADGRFGGRVLNALEHYSLAQTNAASRVRLVNLWSALECLTASENAESMIGSVCSVVVPTVVWRQTSRILSYTAQNLLEFRAVSSGDLGSGFPTDEPGLSSERLLLALARKEGHPHAEELQSFTLEHPLLRFRIFNLWKSISEPVEFAKDLKKSAKQIEWQLYRIYRARNLIVHEGEEVAHIPLLLECLHYYFCVTLSRILHGMQINSTWSVMDSILFWRTRFEYILKSLESNQAEKLQIYDFIPMPRHNLKYGQIWT